jgi:hypothetical protein
MDEKSRQIVRDFFTEEEWDVIDSALDNYQVDEVEAEYVKAVYKKLTALWEDSFANERMHWNAVQP